MREIIVGIMIKAYLTLGEKGRKSAGYFQAIYVQISETMSLISGEIRSAKKPSLLSASQEHTNYTIANKKGLRLLPEPFDMHGGRQDNSRAQADTKGKPYRLTEAPTATS